MSETCFICATPYQIIAAISIAHVYKKNADMYIITDFSQAEEYAKRVRDLNLFSKVDLINTQRFEPYRQSKSKLVYGFGFFFNYLRVNKIVKSIAGDADYKEIFISTHHNIGKFLCIYYLKRGAEVIYYDDGEGSYYIPNVYEAYGLEKAVRTVMFGKQTVGLSRNRMLYSPELFRKVFGNSYNVSAIPNWSKDKTLLKMINHVCGYSDKAKINQKYILLDTIPSVEFDSKGLSIYEELIDFCINCIGSDLLIKRHPRDKREPKYSCEYYKFSDIPFEVICANSEMENKVLICNSSTAAFTPKMLFDLEPTILLLHDLTGGLVKDLKRSQFENCIRDLYRNKARFIVPETKDEMPGILEAIKSEN